MPDESLFAHRRNDDGSFDSICWTCFAAVVRSKPGSELSNYEKTHECELTSNVGESVSRHILSLRV
jgi:hypothetical protein